MKRREVAGITIDVDIANANELYFEDHIAKELPGYDIESIKQYLSGRAETFIPLTVNWEITNGCNFQCPFCYIHTSKSPVVQRNFEEAKEIIDELVHRGMLFCTLTGGECLTNSNFKRIYKYLKESGVLVSVFTNGSMLDEEILQLFEQYKPYKIEVSLYGITEEQFCKVTKQAHNKLALILNNIIQLRDRGIKVYCKTPVTTVTSGDLPEIKQWCKTNGILFYSSPELIDTYYGESVNEYSIPADEIEEYKSRHLHNKVQSSLRKMGKRTLLQCGAGQNFLFISYDGNIYPCSSAYGISSLEIPIKWGSFGESMDKMYLMVGQYKSAVVLGCKGCEFNDICNECLVTQIKRKNNYIQDIECLKYMSIFKNCGGSSDCK